LCAACAAADVLRLPRMDPLTHPAAAPPPPPAPRPLHRHARARARSHAHHNAAPVPAHGRVQRVDDLHHGVGHLGPDAVPRDERDAVLSGASSSRGAHVCVCVCVCACVCVCVCVCARASCCTHAPQHTQLWCRAAGRARLHAAHTRTHTTHTRAHLLMPGVCM
jgi:hypothetical protein